MPAATAPAPAAAQNQQSSKQPVLLVPFTRAAKEHTEPFIDESRQLGAQSLQLGPYDVPAYGFVRHLVLQFNATGGAGTANVQANPDAPFNVIGEISLIDVNGAPIVGPIGGHDLALLNKWGGYRPSCPDPRSDPSYSGVATGANGSGNFSFLLRVPIEINPRDALGCLANQSASSTYKLRITLAPASVVYSTAPNTTLPTVRIRGSLEAWTQPTEADLRGNPNATTPPAHGTTSFWSKTTNNLASGFNTTQLRRVGNYIREIIFIWRDTNGVRTDASFPDPAALYWDTRQLGSLYKDLWQSEMSRRTGLVNAKDTAGGLDTGVYVWSFAHDFDGRIGYEMRDGWLPTAQSTRLELQGTYSAGGTLTVLTNDVAPAGEIFV